MSSEPINLINFDDLDQKIALKRKGKVKKRLTNTFKIH